jgi:hypothetical protein
VTGQPLILYCALAAFAVMLAVLGYSEFYELIVHRALLLAFVSLTLLTHGAVAVCTRKWFTLRYYYAPAIVTTAAFWLFSVLFVYDDLAHVVLEHFGIAAMSALMFFPFWVLVELDTHVTV